MPRPTGDYARHCLRAGPGVIDQRDVSLTLDIEVAQNGPAMKQGHLDDANAVQRSNGTVRANRFR
jgi:hypothetical protein